MGTPYSKIKLIFYVAERNGIREMYVEEQLRRDGWEIILQISLMCFSYLSFGICHETQTNITDEYKYKIMKIRVS